MNILMKGLLKVGITPGEVRVLTVPGRKSGKPRSTPATPFRLGDGFYVVGGYPNADWVLNARAAGVGMMTRGRKSEQVRFIELTPEHARPVLRAFPAKVAPGVRFFKQSGLVTDGTPDEFEALAGRCTAFKLEPA